MFKLIATLAVIAGFVLWHLDSDGGKQESSTFAPVTNVGKSVGLSF